MGEPLLTGGGVAWETVLVGEPLAGGGVAWATVLVGEPLGMFCVGSGVALVTLFKAAAAGGLWLLLEEIYIQ